MAFQMKPSDSRNKEALHKALLGVNKVDEAIKLYEEEANNEEESTIRMMKAYSPDYRSASDIISEIKAAKNKFDEIEQQKKIILPDWYKGYFYTHNKIKMEDRPIEYIYYAIK